MISARSRLDPGRSDTRRGRRRPRPVRHRQRPARLRRDRTDHPRVGPLAPRQSAENPQQAARRRLPLVGLRSPDQITRSPSPLRPKKNRRRPPQRSTAEPGEQAPRTPVVVPGEQPTLGRRHRLAATDNKQAIGRCLTPDSRGMSTCAPGRRRRSPRSSPTRAASASSAAHHRLDANRAAAGRTGDGPVGLTGAAFVPVHGNAETKPRPPGQTPREQAARRHRLRHTPTTNMKGEATGTR